MSKEILTVKNLSKNFPVRKHIFSSEKTIVRAVKDVSFHVYEGETLGIIGESGCGKSTLGRLVIKAISPSSGCIEYPGIDEKEFHRQVHMIFQDPYSALDPRMTIARSIQEPLRIHNIGDIKERDAMTEDVLSKVGLKAEDMYKYPHEFSGGQLQRICIARTLIARPKLLICDEVVSALDVSVQAQVLNLFKHLQKDFAITYLFISHDMAVIKNMSDRIAVMYFGGIVEIAPKHKLFDTPLHPYTKALFEAVPIPDYQARKFTAPIKGELPSPMEEIQGCPFNSRCKHAMDICRREKPRTIEFEPGHSVACHLYLAKGD